MKNCKKWKIYFLQKTKPAEIRGFLLVGLPKNMRFADSCKMRKATSTVRFPELKLLQENQGFFATRLGQNQNSKKRRNPPKNFFIFVKKVIAKKPWFFYHDHE